MSKITIQNLNGYEAQEYIRNLAELRICVFREFPYLYEGSFEYEQKYLQTYFKNSEARVFLCRDEERNKIIGASTCIPLAAENEDFLRPFKNQELNIQDYFYFGESVLLKEYRGQGIGHLFFDHREDHVRSLQRFKYTTFCAVMRSAEDSRRPLNYQPLDQFWKKRGYEKVDGLTAEFSWREIGEELETSKTMQFWRKRLSS